VSRIVICKDKAEALRMLDAGLLMLRVYRDEFKSEFKSASDYDLDRGWVVENYGMSWPLEDFGYLVDDDDG
jgi:hypothetical protein